VLTERFRFYQRLLARDQDEAVEVVDSYVRENPAESACDGIFIPALVLAKRDRALGELSEEHLLWMHRAIREAFEQDVALREDRPQALVGDAEPRTAVLGYAADDEADELALEMLSGVLQERGVGVKALTAKAMVSDVAAMVEHDAPA